MYNQGNTKLELNTTAHSLAWQRVKSLTLSDAGKDAEKINTLNVVERIENVWHYLVNEKYITYDSAVPFPGMYPTETLMYVYHGTCTDMLIKT